MPFFKRTAIWLACTLAFAGFAKPQQEDPAQLTTIRVSVDLVQVDAVVTNSKDEPVTDLTAEDFIILQDGKPQEITHFSFIRAMEPAPAKKPAAVEKGKAKPAPPPPPMPVKRERVRRTYALLVDDLGLTFESTVRVRESIRKWLDNEMQPNDLAAVMRTGGSVGSLQQFTNDRRLLYAAADRLTFNAASRVGVSVNFAQSGKDAYGLQLPMPQEERDLQFTLFTLGSIEYVVDALKELPGRKNLILFSESMKVNLDACSGQSQGRDLFIKDRLRRLMDAANRAAVVIHSIDPRGIVYTGTAAEDCELISSQDGMVMLAKETGGLFMSNRNDIGRALKVVADDGNGYYLIGYPPDEKTVAEMRQGKGRFHDIKVQVKRPGLRVRSRAEFFSTPDQKSRLNSFPDRTRSNRRWNPRLPEAICVCASRRCSRKRRMGNP